MLSISCRLQIVSSKCIASFDELRERDCGDSDVIGPSCAAAANSAAVGGGGQL